MAEYYDMQEVAGKLRKTEEEVQELIKQGQLRQYMDSGKAVKSRRCRFTCRRNCRAGCQLCGTVS